jgi:hypothetical protein
MAQDEHEQIPPTRHILDLDKPLQMQALLEALDLLAHPPPALELPGPLRAWRCQIWVRLSYLLMHSSQQRPEQSAADLAVLARHHSELAQRILQQDRQLAEHWRR